MVVEVRPLPRDKWHGKKNKESFAQTKVIEVLYDKELGGYATGLTDEEAAHYGKLLNVNLSSSFGYDEPHPFYSHKVAWISLPNSTALFHTEKAMDFVKVAALKKHKLVANSMQEYNDGLWPEATHYIFDENEEMEQKATKVQLRQRAYEWVAKLSSDDKISLVQILSNKTIKGRGTNFIDVEIDAIITEKPAEFLKYVDMGREQVNVRATVLRLLNKNVLTKEGPSVYYMGDLLGMDYEETVAWFLNPQNSRLKVSILEKDIDATGNIKQQSKITEKQTA